MQALLSIILMAALLSGCGATYTRFEQAKTSPQASGDECPNGIDYKTGQCS